MNVLDIFAGVIGSTNTTPIKNKLSCMLSCNPFAAVKTVAEKHNKQKQHLFLIRTSLVISYLLHFIKRKKLRSK